MAVQSSRIVYGLIPTWHLQLGADMIALRSEDILWLVWVTFSSDFAEDV